MTIVASLILASELPTTSTYVLLFILIISAMVTIGVPGMATHLFAFYYGAISN